MSSKVEFLTRLEAAKEKLPVGAVPLYLKIYPGSEKNISRIKNTLSGRIQDDLILRRLEDLVIIIERIAEQSAAVKSAKK